MKIQFFALTTSMVVAIWISALVWSNNRELGISEVDYSEQESSGRFLESVGLLPDDSLLGFVQIEEGEFIIGSDPRRDPLAFDNEIWPDANPSKIVEIPEFYMSRFEVTVGQFREFKEETGYFLNLSGESLEHPVSGVSWTDAVAYTRWIDEKLRVWTNVPPKFRDLLDKGWMVSLPNEMQWEKAARGKDGRLYPWGNELRVNETRGNFRGQKTLTVGSLPCGDCAYGLHDMSGNVWEWTSSAYGDYPIQMHVNQANFSLTGDALWVMRGGSFADTERYVRSATRGAADPGVRRPFIGFRLALSKISD